MTLPRASAALLGLTLAALTLSLSFRAVSSRQTHGDWPLPGKLELHWVRALPAQKPAWPDQPLLQIDAAPRPVALGETLFLASARTDSVTAYDMDTGAEKWHFSTNGPIRFAPVIWEERLYFGSDDGYLYCLAAEEGRLLWKVRGGPSDRLLLGNGRLISTWPVRGAPVVVTEEESSGRPATVYFAAGVWPFMGVFLHALDARTGAVLWTNDGDGSIYIKQPHQADAFAGVAPQGPLVVAGDRLLVPGGRSVPACYDRHTGKLLHFLLADNSRRGGGPNVSVQGQLYFNGGGVFDLETGTHVGTTGEFTAGREGLLYSWSGSECQTLDVRKAAPVITSTKESKKPLKTPTWSPTRLRTTAMPRIAALIQADGRLFAGLEGQVLAFDLPLPNGPGRPSWQGRLEGRPVHLLAAEERLFVTTTQGRLYCFGAPGYTPPAPQRGEGVAHLLPSSFSPEERGVTFATATDDWDDKAHDILERTGVRQGYCIAWGAGSGRLVEELLARSQLSVVVIEADEHQAQVLRERLEAAGLYGDRAAVLRADLDSVQLPPYLASLMVSEDLDAIGLEAGPETLRRLFRSLRPYGGIACLPVPAAKRPDLSGLPSQEGDLSQVRVRYSDDWLLLSRDGPLPGAGNWTHEHADAANTRVAPDQRVKAPLGLLWFGGNSNEAILPRHGHGPQPQVIDGRLIIEGPDSLRATDIYTGRLLWETRLPGLGQVYDNTAHQPGANACGTNYISMPDGIYVIHERHCLCLALNTGRELSRFPLPVLPGVKEKLTWSYLNVCGDYLIGMANPPASDPKSKLKALSSSRHLVVLNRHDGRLLWSRTAQNGFRHNALCAGGGRLYTIDRPSTDYTLFVKKKATDKNPPARLLALDLRSGKEVWSSRSDVFGTWLSYSAKHDVLVESGRLARDTLGDEPRGMRVYTAGRGKVLWYRQDYAGPAMIHGERILKDGSACDLLTGAPYLRPDPLTGQPTEWTWTRTYGCNTPCAAEHLLTFRSGAAGYYDLCNEGGTGNFGGFRSGCTNNLIVAGGLLNAPDYTRTCTCSYQNQTSLALVPTPDAEMWTFQGGAKEVKGVVRQVGLLLGAPGNRKADNGTLWLEYPPVGGPSPRLTVKTEPEKPEWFRRHSSQIEGVGPTWLAASGAKGLRSLSLTLGSPADKVRSYTVRLYFVEPDRLPAGQRRFDVALQGQTVCHDLDVCREAGGPNRMLVKEFHQVQVKSELTVQLTPAPEASVPTPVLCGVEVVAEGW